MTLLSFGPQVLNDFSKSSLLEWLETNGLGGWAGGTVAGVNTRRYHGLLVSALKPPVQRMVLLSRLDETLCIGSAKFELGCNQFPGSVHPQGFKYLTSFTKDLFPTWEFEVQGAKLKKTIAAIHGHPITLIMYEVKKAQRPFQLQLKPLVAARDYHSLVSRNDAIRSEMVKEESSYIVQPYENGPKIFFKIPGASFQAQPEWYFNFEYLREQERGFEFKEDLFSLGTFEVTLEKGATFGVLISSEEVEQLDAKNLLKQEEKRRQALLDEAQSHDEIVKSLILAADQCLVKRGTNGRTIIAGYPWFTDWGRDTMISIPGICLATGRTEEVKSILKAFLEFLSEGMIPNRFPDGEETPEYNTVDATLWFFVAAYQYFKQTNDTTFAKQELLPAFLDIIQWHTKGTRYQIRVDEDGLLSAGDPHTQLTWMDARIGNYAVTPRYGKPVEINALWYNALKITAELCDLFKKTGEARSLEGRAAMVKEAFSHLFWFEEGKYCCDCVNGSKAEGAQRDTTLRPNQLLALSLPFPLIEGEKAKQVLEVVEDKLLTPRGLRTLSPQHSSYRGRYEGDSWSRDTAYHQGTVWPWLLGPYITAQLRFGGFTGIKKSQRLLDSMGDHLLDAGIGSISEIFDAESPYCPRGCPFQAWSVAEVLRAWYLVKAAETVKSKETSKASSQAEWNGAPQEVSQMKG